MDKNEILALPYTQDAINDLYDLINTSYDPQEVLMARIKLAEILESDHHFKEATTLLLPLLETFSHQKEKEDYFTILNILIRCYINLEDQENALKYITLKKEALPILESHLYLEDLIRYKEAFKVDFEAEVSALLEAPVPKHRKIELLLSRIERNKHDNTHKVLEDINRIIPLNPSKEELSLLWAIELEIDFQNGQYDKIINLLKEDLRPLSIYYQVLSHIKLENTKQASILEVEYEHLFIELEPLKQKHLYQSLRDFYTSISDLRSIELYEEKLKKIDKILKREESVETKAPHVHEFSIPKPKKIAKITEEETKKPIITSNLKDQRTLSNIDQYLTEVLALNKQLDRHEYHRQLFMTMEKHFDFSDLILYERPHLYHYKKGRLYEKQIDRHRIDASIVGIAANDYKDIIEKVEYLKYNYDIISQKPLTETTVKNVYCYALPNKSSLCFYQTTDKALIYDDMSLKIASQTLAYEFSFFQALLRERSRSEDLKDLFQSKAMGLSIKTNGRFLFNDTLLLYLPLRRRESFEQIYEYLEPKDAIRLKEQMGMLERGEIDLFSEDVCVLERSIRITQTKHKDAVFGFYLDITQDVKKMENWKEKALYDVHSELFTLSEFERRFTEVTLGKVTFILASLEDLDHIEFIYGKALALAYFLEFGKLAKTRFERVYHFDSNTILIEILQNDVRAIENHVKLFLKDLEDTPSKTLEDQPFKTHMGIIRYPINTRETDIKKIYAYLSFSLLRAKRSYSGYRHAYFNFEAYLQEVHETEIIKQIDRLITTESLDITFNQIANQQTNLVYAYEIEPYSETLHIESDYYHQVAFRRDQTEKLERYLLITAFKRLSSIYNETNKYIKLSITLSPKTIQERLFNPFLIGLYKTYNIPYHIVDIIVSMKDGKVADYEKMKELHDLGINIGTDHYNFLKEPQTKIFHLKDRPSELTDRFLNAVKHLKMYTDDEQIALVIYHVDRVKDRTLLKSLGIDYIRGKTVDRKYTYEELLRIIKGVK